MATEDRLSANDWHQPNEPIAVLGIGCRFPGGVSSPDDLWQLLSDGTRHGLRSFPPTAGGILMRCSGPTPTHRGPRTSAQGHSVANVGDFDAAFFGIGPREAQAMDPQQRLLLEVTWEALERAGDRPDFAARQ